jgi:hypothetical protein
MNIQLCLLNCCILKYGIMRLRGRGGWGGGGLGCMPEAKYGRCSQFTNENNGLTREKEKD